MQQINVPEGIIRLPPREARTQPLMAHRFLTPYVAQRDVTEVRCEQLQAFDAVVERAVLRLPDNRDSLRVKMVGCYAMANIAYWLFDHPIIVDIATDADNGRRRWAELTWEGVSPSANGIDILFSIERHTDE